MTKVAFKDFEHCTPRELVRYTDKDGGTHWAIVGHRGNEVLMLLVLQLNAAPYCINIMGNMDIVQHPFGNTVVMSYGAAYVARADHAGDCEVGGGGKLIGAHGSFVVTAKDELISCRDDRVPKKTAYFDLKTGRVISEPGAQRACFARWDLILTPTDEPQTTVLQVHSNKAPVIVAPILVSGPRGTAFDNKQ